MSVLYSLPGPATEGHANRAFGSWRRPRPVSGPVGRGCRWALVAVGRSILIIVWQLLSDPDAEFHDLAANFYDTRLGTERAKRNHVHHLEALGFKVTLEPAA